MTRKYEEVKGYWVYSIKVPSINKYYIGVSKTQCRYRWKKSHYKDNSLTPYLEEWDSMEKTVLIDGLNKQDAFMYEDNIIRALKMNDLCINERRSGLIKVSDVNAYQRELYQNNPEYREHKKQRSKQWWEDNKEKLKEQAK